MRVKFTNEMKKFVTVAEMPVVRQLIQDMKEDECPPEEYARIAMSVVEPSAVSSQFEIFKATAEVTKNSHVNDRYFDGSGRFDVWISFVAYSSFYGAYECGIYLSDIWDMSFEPDNYDSIRSRMFIKAFTKQENRA